MPTGLSEGEKRMPPEEFSAGEGPLVGRTRELAELTG